MTRVKESKRSEPRYWEITEEYLAKLNDDDLKRVFIKARTLLNKERRSKQNRNALRAREIDLCYIQKELQNRRECKK